MREHEVKEVTKNPYYTKRIINKQLDRRVLRVSPTKNETEREVKQGTGDPYTKGIINKHLQSASTKTILYIWVMDKTVEIFNVFIWWGKLHSGVNYTRGKLHLGG